MKASVIQKRLQNLREEMAVKGITFYLIPTADYHNSEYVDGFFKVREYFSGFTGSNGTLVVSEAEVGLWTDGRYFIQAEKELAGTGIKLFRMLEEGVPTIKEYLAESTKDGDVIAFDGRVVDTAFGKSLSELLSEKNVSLKMDEDLAGELWKERAQLPSHPVRILPQNLHGMDMQDKVEQVRKVMREKQCSAFLLSKLDDLMWLLNIRGADVECNPVALSYGFITQEKIFFFIQKSEVTEEFREYAKNKNIVIKEYEEIVPFLQSYPYNGKVMGDSRHLNYLLYQTVWGNTEFVDVPNPTEILKAIKNPTELENMRRIFLKDSVAVTKFIFWLKKSIGREKITELSAAAYLDGLREQIEEYLDLSFPTISAYKENAAMMHYEATKECHKELKEEGMLLVDSGGQYFGGTTDVTRTIVLGEISEEIKKHYSAVAAGMLQLTHANFFHGCTGRNMDILARQPLWDMNIDYKCGTGHGIGYILNVHEGPQGLRWRYNENVKEAVLEEGMVVTNEPGVYVEGSHGIRIENVMAVQNGIKNGDGQFMHFETLTYVPIDRMALDKKYLRKEDVERIDLYHSLVFEKISPYLSEEEQNWLKAETAPL